ncbi:MAG: hypothetical protein PF487_09085 [Bacteroidales bacterium]|jgi:hypothetical protein|nr:hypothetical protein [Bacteroidales bacterium]
MMTVGTITGLLKTLKKDLLLKFYKENRSVDKPEINQNLNDMLNNIIIELETAIMREQICQEDFDSLVEFAENYTCQLQV